MSVTARARRADDERRGRGDRDSSVVSMRATSVGTLAGWTGYFPRRSPSGEGGGGSFDAARAVGSGRVCVATGRAAALVVVKCRAVRHVAGGGRGAAKKVAGLLLDPPPSSRTRRWSRRRTMGLRWRRTGSNAARTTGRTRLRVPSTSCRRSRASCEATARGRAREARRKPLRRVPLEALPSQTLLLFAGKPPPAAAWPPQIVALRNARKGGGRKKTVKARRRSGAPSNRAPAGQGSQPAVMLNT